MRRRAFLHSLLFAPVIGSVIGPRLARAAAQTRPAPAPASHSTLFLPLRIVQMTDSQGNAEFAGGDTVLWTPALLDKQIARKSTRCSQNAQITFTLDAARDFETRRDDFLFVDFDPIFSGPALKNRAQPPEKNRVARENGLQAIADETPNRLTIITRRGSNWKWDADGEKWQFGIGYSKGGSLLENTPATISGTAPRLWAHELGHELGLLHTSRDGADAPSALDTEAKISAACQAYLDDGGDPNHPEYGIDGDLSSGVSDTPPDPGVGFWKTKTGLQATVTLRLAGRAPQQILVSRNNLMAATPGPGNFTAGQIALMRSAAQKWQTRK